MTTKSGKHANKTFGSTKDKSAKAVDMRKVAALSAGAAGVIAGAAIAFGATPAMAAETPTSAPVNTNDSAKEQNLVASNKAEDSKKTATDTTKKDDASKVDVSKKNSVDAKPVVEAPQQTKVEAPTDSKKSADAKQSVEPKVTAAPIASTESTEENKTGKTESANGENAKADGKSVDNQDAKQDSEETGTPAGSVVNKRTRRSLDEKKQPEPTKDAQAENQDRAEGDSASQDPNKIKPDTTDTTNTKINIDENNAGTMPNMYGWGSSDNTYSVNGETHTVTFNFSKPKDGGTITAIAIFPAQNNGLTNDKSKRGAEYYSGDDKMHQSFSGNYKFTQNQDGSATLTMSDLFRDGSLNGGAEAYAANRTIFVYVTDGTGKESIAYKTNVFRAATLVPPKTSGAVVLKYDQPLTKEQIQAAIIAAANAETARKDKKSVNDQIVAASKSTGVNTTVNGKSTQVPDKLTDKLNVKSDDAYDKTTFEAINKETSAQGATDKTYVAGAKTLNTYMVTDLGFKSGAIPLTVARYDTRIDKPIVEDPTKLSQEVKEDIAKKLAKISDVSTDKVTFDGDGNAVIHFDGVDEKDAPKIPLRDLVLKQLKDSEYTVPSNDKAVFVANPLGYSNAELDRIKQAIFDANKENKDLGLTSVDQITLEYVKGDTTVGHENIGISNGQAENKITVKIKTDKAVAEFTSNVKENRLTKLPNIRTDYDVTWTKTKIDGRDTDEGISWSNDQKTTIIYRYDPTKAQEFDTTKILGLLKATPKDTKSGLRDLTGGELLSYEGTGNNARKSHMHYALQNGEPTGELTLGNMGGAYWSGNQKVSNSDVNLGDEEATVGKYSWDQEAGFVEVAAKQNKVFKARLFVEPYGMTYYKDVYLEKGSIPGNTAKAINVIFVPQTNHKTKDLSDSIGKHKLADDKKTPTEAKYYNASADKKDAYEKALDAAKTLYNSVKDTDESKLTEDQKAQIDNATITLNKAREALDGADTNKDGLTTSIEANGKAAEGSTAATGTQATNQFKNVSNPDFKTPDGKPDTKKNEAAKKAKEDYDKALEEAKALKDDENATQKAVDAAKAKLDAARAKLNDFTTNKDELSAAIATDGKVNTGDTKKTDPAEKLKTADPTYQNSSETERKAYDDAVAEAQKVVADPNASQKEVNEAIKKLKDAKAALDKNATDKAPLDAAVQKSFDNPDPTKPDKQSVFYKNAKAKTNDPDAKKAVEDYDKALAEAKRVLGDKNATNDDVKKAKEALEKAEAALHADKYQTKATDLAKAIADNFSGYLMPAYFNAFDKAQAEGKDSQAAKDFKAYNDAYHAAKDLMEQLKKPDSTIKQTDVDKVKDQLIAARKIIDTYATDTSRLSAAVFNDIAIKNSPAYKNLKALAEKENPSEEEKAEVEAAKKAKKAYDDAAEKLHNAITNQLPRDKANDQDIPDSNIPKKDGDLNNKDYLKDIQAHKNGEPLNRDVDSILQEMNEAAKALDKFKTNTDDLIKSINEDATTHPSPAFKNASQPNYQKPDGSGPDDTKNAAARKAASDYGQALNEAKDLLNNPNATQKDINDAKDKLDKARKALDDYKTDVSKLQESANKHGKEKQGDTAATEGTVTSDAYRNASDPHFMKEEGGKLVPDDDKNKKAAEDKKAYDEALTKAQELLKKHDSADTPQDAKPTQQQINDALKALDEARTKLDTYKTDTTKLDAEAQKSTADGGTLADTDFESTPEFKNADDQKGEGNKDAASDVKAYKDALKKARDLVKAATSTDPNTKNSDRPTQQQINDALEALKNAKKQITDNYKTNLDELTAAKDFANGDFKKTPEYKNAVALKDDQNADQTKKDAAKKAIDALDDTVTDSALKKAMDIIANPTGKTQKEVDAARDTLQKAMKAVTDNYKTDVKPLENEVGDKDTQGNPVLPPFEATVEYKNALEKAKTEDPATTDANSATVKLKAYADKLAKANELINKVNNPDPNAKPEDRPTQKQVDDALAALKQAKKDIDDNFKTKVDKLQNEVDDKNDDGSAKQEADQLEKSTEFANLKDKTKDGKKPDDLVAYEKALAKAKELIDKNDGKVTKDGQEVDVPKDQLPTQQEVEEAKKALKEIKEKIFANYKTNPHDLQEEVKDSKIDDDDKRDTTFENTPEFKNATGKGDDASKQALKDYKDKLDAAKKLLDKFDPTTGKPKTDLPAGEKAPTQKELDDALDALQAAKKKITDGYKTNTDGLKEDYDNRNKEQTSDYTMASKDKQKAYSDALDEANKVLNDLNATQAQVDAARAKLKDALEELEKSANANRRAIYEDMVIDARNALQKLVDANEATHLKDLYTHAEPAAQHEFMAAMDNAKKVLADKEALASELDAARVRLLRALDGLAKHQLPGMTNAGANGNAGAGANGAAGYGAHAAGAYGRGAHAAGRVRAHAGKHLAQTSDPTNALAAAGMLASALGFIAMGFKTKKRRAK